MFYRFYNTEPLLSQDHFYAQSLCELHGAPAIPRSLLCSELMRIPRRRTLDSIRIVFIIITVTQSFKKNLSTESTELPFFLAQKAQRLNPAIYTLFMTGSSSLQQQSFRSSLHFNFHPFRVITPLCFPFCCQLFISHL